MPPQPSTDFEIQKYYQNKPKVYSINSLSKRKHGASVTNLDEYNNRNSLNSIIGECWECNILW